MANPSKRKGSAFERDVADFFQQHGFPEAERTYIIGLAADKGDIAGIPGVVIQCKSTTGIDLAGALDDAQKQAANKPAEFGFAVHKRRMKPTGEAYATMRLADLATILERLAAADEVLKWQRDHQIDRGAV